MKKYKYVCDSCGSDSVTIEAIVVWDIEKQEFIVDEIMDKGHYCEVCDCDCYIEKKEIGGEE